MTLDTHVISKRSGGSLERMGVSKLTLVILGRSISTLWISATPSAPMGHFIRPGAPSTQRKLTSAGYPTIVLVLYGTGKGERRLPDFPNVRLVSSDHRMGEFKTGIRDMDATKTWNTAGRQIVRGAAHDRVSVGRERDFRSLPRRLPSLERENSAGH